MIAAKDAETELLSVEQANTEHKLLPILMGQHYTTNDG